MSRTSGRCCSGWMICHQSSRPLKHVLAQREIALDTLADAPPPRTSRAGRRSPRCNRQSRTGRRRSSETAPRCQADECRGVRARSPPIASTSSLSLIVAAVDRLVGIGLVVPLRNPAGDRQYVVQIPLVADLVEIGSAWRSLGYRLKQPVVPHKPPAPGPAAATDGAVSKDTPMTAWLDRAFQSARLGYR